MKRHLMMKPEIQQSHEDECTGVAGLNSHHAERGVSRGR
jgi:hypothetical protein